MRRFIRHPTDIPINLVPILPPDFANTVHYTTDTGHANNLSEGGLSALSHQYIEPGTAIHIDIPLVQPSYHGEGIVCWCKPCLTAQPTHNFDVGIRFQNSDDEFRNRMIEQVCQIERYRRELEQEEGREISSEEAAQSWISRYAEEFSKQH